MEQNKYYTKHCFLKKQLKLRIERVHHVPGKIKQEEPLLRYIL